MYSLVVTDDEQEIRSSICSLFPWSSLGFEVVHQCESGTETIEYLKRHSVDVLLTDICLADISGIDIARFICAQKLPTTVVFISGYQEFSFARSALKYRVFDYILKPTDYESIQNVFSALKASLDQKRCGSFQSAATADTPMSYPEKVISETRRYIQKHLSDVTYITAAENVGFNPSYFSTYFKKYTGENFSDYLLRIKMERARELLGDISLRTSEISSMLGYSTVSNFSRVFKSYYHLTPGEYRKGENL